MTTPTRLPSTGSRCRSCLCALLLCVAAGARPLAAQGVPRDSAPGRAPADSLSLDSLRARLARAEAAIALLREELGGESESTVHTRSRVRVDVSARVLTNFFATSGRTNLEDVPIIVLPPGAAPPPAGAAVGAAVRQTRFGIATSVADVLGGTFDADADFDLFGGVQNGPGDRRLFPEPRLRTARARLTWNGTVIMVGADTPLISDLDPVSLAAVGLPEFSAAGNLWNWLPQLRVTRELARDTSAAAGVRWAVQAAVMSPYAAQLAPGEPDAIDAGDRSRRPAFEARLRARWGEESDATIADGLIARGGGEIGVGMHRAWLTMAPGLTKESHAVSIDLRAVVRPGIEVRGEAYTGRLLRGLGGGGIAQNFGSASAEYSAGPPADSIGPAVRDVAGWIQLNVQPHPLILGSIGCGVDVANPDDYPTRLQNTACAVGISWRPAQPLVLGLEYRRLATRYRTGTYGADHVNLALGFDL